MFVPTATSTPAQLPQSRPFRLCTYLADLIRRVIAAICCCFIPTPAKPISQTASSSSLADRITSPAPPILSLPGSASLPVPPASARPSTIEEVVAATPQFSGYRLSNGSSLLNMLVRPSNLLFDAISQDAGGIFGTTRPGSRDLFEWVGETTRIRPHIQERAAQEAVLEISAKGLVDQEQTRLEPIYGPATYRISYQELLDTLNSQRIFLSPDMPLIFFQALKEALHRDGIVTLPGDGRHPVIFGQSQSLHLKALIADARANPQGFGFLNGAALEEFLKLTFYQIGAMVVKTEDFRILIDGRGKIIERAVGTPDTIQLINMCGIRAIRQTDVQHNGQIMRDTFLTSLQAAEKDFVIFPAVGMGVWRGPPELYWPSFFHAVAHCDCNLERIFVHAGGTSDEFHFHLRQAKELFKGNLQAEANLNKLFDLTPTQTDVVQFAHNLKRAFSDKRVSLVNASDPDVTLSWHVGEYVNNRAGVVMTTEENYTALGTNGLCFEWLTHVHAQRGRIFSF